jgi:hypothetical protein
MDIHELRLTDVPADLVLLLQESSNAVDDVTYEATADGTDLVVTASVLGESRTFRLTTHEEN